MRTGGKYSVNEKIFLMSRLFMTALLFISTCANAFPPITSNAVENIAHNVWIDSSTNEIKVRSINGGEIIDGYCIDLDKVINGATSEDNSLKYEEVTADDPQTLFDLIAPSAGI